MFVSDRESTDHSGLGFTYSIPSDWSLVRFSFFIGFQEGPGIMAADFRDEGTPLLRIRNVQSEVVDLDGCNYLDPIDVEERWSKYRVQKDDLLISCSASTGLVTKVDDRAEGAIAYTGLIRLWPQRSEITRDFIRWLVQSEIFFNQVDVLKTGSTMQHFGPEHLGRMFITLPPRPEQERIASFLDWKTGEIDCLIAKKRALISALAEKRMAVITQAVTRGLNPDAPLKETGIPWLREVPEHWEVKKLKFSVSKVNSGVTPKGGAESYEQDGIPLLRSQNVHFDSLRLDDVVYISKETHASMENSILRDGDVLLNITGASIGRANFVPDGFGDANVNQHVCIIRPEEELLTKFLHYLLWCEVGQMQIDLEQGGAGREGLNFGALKNFLIPVPASAEQAEIVAHLDGENKKLCALIEISLRAIDRLAEYRTALITAATTGKIDVRNVDIPAAQEPAVETHDATRF